MPQNPSQYAKGMALLGSRVFGEVSPAQFKKFSFLSAKNHRAPTAEEDFVLHLDMKRSKKSIS